MRKEDEEGGRGQGVFVFREEGATVKDFFCVFAQKNSFCLLRCCWRRVFWL